MENQAVITKCMRAEGLTHEACIDLPQASLVHYAYIASQWYIFRL